jgi:hypothetical protein
MHSDLALYPKNMEPEYMSFETTEETPLRQLYLQIEYAELPFEILAINKKPTEVEVREGYRALALRIHPDKAPTEQLQEIHSYLFKKVHGAYEYFQTTYSDVWNQPDEVSTDQITEPPETWETLHAHNVAFREALREERDAAIKAKHAAETLEASKNARLQAKNARLAAKREARAIAREDIMKKKANDVSFKIKQIAKRSTKTQEKQGR